MTKPMATLAALLAALLGGARPAIPQGPQQQSSPRAIRVQTDLVSILASVTDANGKPIPDLTQDEFQLSEENVPQKIERFEAETSRPLDLVLMVDSSMSTFKDLKFEEAAAAHFIQQIVRPDDTLCVYAFSDSVVALSHFSDNVATLQEATKRIEPGAGTSMYDAIVTGSNALKRRPPNRRRAVVLVTDAGETTSDSEFDDARRAAIASNALLYSVVIRPVKNENGRNTAGEHALITIMDSTGGDFFILDEMNQLQQIFDKINRELRTQYLLEYYPQPTPPPGTDRHVSVVVTGGYVVRARTEYFTSAAPH